MTIKIHKYKKLLIPAGEYDAKIINVEAMKSKYSQKDQIRIEFELSGYLFQERPEITPKISAYFNTTTHEKSAFVKKFFTPLMGRTPIDSDYDENEDLDVEKFREKQCRIRVEHGERDNGELFAKIAKIMGKSGQEN